MVTVSPPVSPSVVAAILMIQKPRVSSGTLVANCPERHSELQFGLLAQATIVHHVRGSEPSRQLALLRKQGTRESDLALGRLRREQQPANEQSQERRDRQEGRNPHPFAPSVADQRRDNNREGRT
jgi:hypothetical protein